MTKVNVYSIDNGIPLPEVKRMPLNDMEVGDSILFPLNKRPNIQSVASRLKRETGKTFVVKKMDDNNARIWRAE